jgi:hypothetical protein
MKFNTIHSLGSRCQNSEILKHYNYREFSGFFDFMNTSKIEIINHIIKDDFKELLKTENNVTVECNVLTIDPETGARLPKSLRTANRFYDNTLNMNNALFPHHNLNDEKDKKHFINCHQRFKKLVNFTPLFNYTYNTWENSPTIEQLEEMVESLKTVHNFKNFKVCFIGVKISNDLGSTLIKSTEFYDIWSLNISPSSFTGGLFLNETDNINYINIIKSYDIEEVRISKEVIDSIPNISNEINYNSWPIGRVPKHMQRPELDKLKELNYNWVDPRDVVDMFETKVAEFSGSKYAVSVDCCSHGLFLSMKYLQSIGELKIGDTLTIPKMTYVSAPMQIIHAGNKVEFEDLEWSGVYQFKGSRVWDGAVRWTKNMYVGNNALQVVSFQLKKRVPIGKGGIILTDSLEAYKWLKLASYDGRDLSTPYTYENHIQMLGYHMYMTPEDAARGIILIDNVPEVNEDTGNHTTYVDVSKVFNRLDLLQ